jgi:hypothetical protein
MTTEAPRHPGLARPILIALPLVVAGWLGTLAGVLALTGAAPAVLVLAPGGLPTDASILSAGRYHLVVESADPDLATRLYALGAGLVLPWGLSGCLLARG